MWWKPPVLHSLDFMDLTALEEELSALEEEEDVRREKDLAQGACGIGSIEDEGFDSRPEFETHLELDASNNKVAHEEPTGETDDVTLCDK